MKIEDIKLKIIPDSKGKDTLEATLKSGSLEASASVPSGKSTGATEVAVLPPSQAVDKISWLISQLKDHEFVSLEQFDELLITLDGTKNKSRLGGNLILSLSMAYARLLAKAGNLELFELLGKISGTRQFKMPFCFFNLIEGGVHAPSTSLRASLPFQEYLLIPQTDSPKQSLEIVMKAIKLLGEKTQKEYGRSKQGDEGGYSIPSDDPIAGLKILQEVFSRPPLEYSRGGLIQFGLDVAASTMKQDNGYKVGKEIMSGEQLLELYKEIANKFTLLSIEDPFDEEDWQGFSEVTAQIGKQVWIIGDDLLTTNVERIKKAYQLQAVNAVLVKPNQIGTVTETIQAVLLARNYGWKTVVSHRSGETMDTFIADLAVGLGADGLKSGCPLQKERLVKYKRLVEIERCLIL